MAEEHRFCVVVPVYDHHEALEAWWEGLRALGLPVVIVDDGSGERCRSRLEALAAGAGGTGVRLIRLPLNRGKGAAVKAALRLAAGLGFTHAAQVDADGQHDLRDLARLLEASRGEPSAAVCGEPRFGPDAPANRLRWRRLTNFWLAVNTLSKDIPDGMCGLRVYPLAATLPLLGPTGDRMEFDPEILARLSWAGVPLRFLPVSVRYPEGGRSGFRAFEDNVRISWMHTRLFFGMLRRLPVRAFRAPRRGRR